MLSAGENVMNYILARITLHSPLDPNIVHTVLSIQYTVQYCLYSTYFQYSIYCSYSIYYIYSTHSTCSVYIYCIYTVTSAFAPAWVSCQSKNSPRTEQSVQEQGSLGGKCRRHRWGCLGTSCQESIWVTLTHLNVSLQDPGVS